MSTTDPSTTGGAAPGRPPGADLPAYAGTADHGVRDSVPASDPMAGDAASVVQAETRKLDGLFGAVAASLGAGDLDGARRQWFGVVREALEYQAAVGRVLLPVLADDERARLEQERSGLLDRLGPYDQLNPALDPDDVVALCTGAVAVLHRQLEALLPALEVLGDGERDQLGEDLRQVMG